MGAPYQQIGSPTSTVGKKASLCRPLLSTGTAMRIKVLASMTLNEFLNWKFVNSHKIPDPIEGFQLEN